MIIAKNWQRVEGALVFAGALAIYLSEANHFPWWAAILIFFAPDLSFAGYGANTKVGAALYNAVHIYGFGAALMALGLVAGIPLLFGLGALWLAHSGFDRLLGYGLKSPDSFSRTHLGPIGRTG